MRGCSLHDSLSFVFLVLIFWHQECCIHVIIWAFFFFSHLQLSYSLLCVYTHTHTLQLTGNLPSGAVQTRPVFIWTFKVLQDISYCWKQKLCGFIKQCHVCSISSFLAKLWCEVTTKLPGCVFSPTLIKNRSKSLFEKTKTLWNICCLYFMLLLLHKSKE